MQQTCAVVFDPIYDSLAPTYTLFQVSQQMLAQLEAEGRARISALSLQHDSYLITGSELYRLKRTQHQNMTLVAVHSTDLTIKCNTSTIIHAQSAQPHYHEIYRHLKSLSLRTYEVDLELCYDKMYSYEDLLGQFVISAEQLREFLRAFNCFTFRDRLYHFDEGTYINLLRYITMVVMEARLTEFRIQDLKIQEKLMEQFVVGTLNHYRLGTDGVYKLDFLTLARSVITELLLQKPEFIFNELWEAFWMMIPTFYDFDTLNTRQDQVELFQQACRPQTVCIDTNSYIRPIKDFSGYIIRRIDKHEFPNDSLERLRALSQAQPKFLIEQIQQWLSDAGRSPKEITDTIQRHCKAVNEQVHASNIDKLQQVYPGIENVKQIRFYTLK